MKKIQQLQEESEREMLAHKNLALKRTINNKPICLQKHIKPTGICLVTQK